MEALNSLESMGYQNMENEKEALESKDVETKEVEKNEAPEAPKANSVSDLIAERDSLLEELEKKKAEMELLQAELQETKKLNFTLGRTIGTGKSAEENATDALRDMFKQIR